VTEPEGIEWSLREANAEEMKRASRDIRVVTGIAFALGLSVSVAAFALLSGTDGSAPALIATLAPVVIATWASRRLQRARSAPLEASVVVGTWLAREGLVDPEGRLTPAARGYLDRPRTETGSLESETGDAGGGFRLEQQRRRALEAYLQAHRLHAIRDDWLRPIQEVAQELGTGEVRGYLAEEIRVGTGRRVNFFITAFALLGAALLGWSIITMVLHQLEL
jgi:hypothetical protein